MHKVEEVVQAFPDDLKQIHARAEELATMRGFGIADPAFYLLALVESAAGPETPQFDTKTGKEPSDVRSKNSAAITWLRFIGATKHQIAVAIDEYFHHVDHPSKVHDAAKQAYSHMMYELGDRCRAESGNTPALYQYDLLAAIALSESALVNKVFSSLGLSGDYLREALRLEPPLPSHIDPRLAAV